MTRNHPTGSSWRRSSSEAAARSCRRRRFRTTAGPTRLGTAKARPADDESSRSSATTVSGPRRARLPLVRKRRNTSRSRIRSIGRIRRSGREALAALAPAILDDRSTGAGRHPLAKAVLLGLAPVVGLVGPLHLISTGASHDATGVVPNRRVRVGTEAGHMSGGVLSGPFSLPPDIDAIGGPGACGWPDHAVRMTCDSDATSMPTGSRSRAG